MKKHRCFEFYAANCLKERGYQVDVTQAVGDWGVDIFCNKNEIKYVAQVKMYGTSKTKISRKDMMELYGAMVYFDCLGAIMIYTGCVTSGAKKVAKKLGIELMLLDPAPVENYVENDNIEGEDVYSFDHIWNTYIMPLKGKEIRNELGTVYEIVDVTAAYIERISSKGKKSRVKSDLFKWVINRLHRVGHVDVIDLRDEFKTQHSSFVTSVFNNIDLFEVEYSPRVIRFKDRGCF